MPRAELSSSTHSSTASEVLAGGRGRHPEYSGGRSLMGPSVRTSWKHHDMSYNLLPAAASFCGSSVGPCVSRGVLESSCRHGASALVQTIMSSQRLILTVTVVAWRQHLHVRLASKLSRCQCRGRKQVIHTVPSRQS